MYAQQVLETETYFEPLTYFYENHKLGSPDPDAFQFKTKLKQTYWDCEWSEEDDKALLRGIYEHGYGNWEWIKTDPALKLENKILMVSDSVVDANGNGESRGPKTGAKSGATGASNTGVKLKPQSKHLRTRIDYLIKVLQNQMNVEKYGANWKSVIEPNTPAVNKSSSGSIQSARKKQNESVINNTDENSNGADAKSNRKRHAQEEGGGGKARRKLKQAMSGNLIEQVDSNDSDQSDANTDAKKKKPNPRGDDSENSDADTSTVANKKHNKHHHHHHTDSSLNFSKETTNTAMALGTSAQSNPSGAGNSNASSSKEKKIVLDEKTFEECKNILRPVKRALKDINIIESSNALTDKTHLDQVRRLVLDIGDKINDHLASYSDLEKINKWRNYLWAFVAKFTTSWNFERIKNLYKKFAKHRDDEQLNNNNSSSNTMNSSYQSHSSYGGYRYKDDNKHSSSYNNSSGQYDSSSRSSKKPHFDNNNRYNSSKEKSSRSSYSNTGGSSSRREFHGGQSSGYRHNNSVNNDNSHDGSYSQRMDSMTNDR